MFSRNKSAKTTKNKKDLFIEFGSKEKQLRKFQPQVQSPCGNVSAALKPLPQCPVQVPREVRSVEQLKGES